MSPSKCWLFVDEHEDSIDDGWFAVEMLSQAFVDLPASHHSGGTCLAFVDGHIEMKKWTDPRTRRPLLRQMRFGGPDFFPNNNDILWLQQHTTYDKQTIGEAY